jgi:hypothetical protein
MWFNKIIQYYIINGICKDEISFTLTGNVNIINTALFVFLYFLAQWWPLFLKHVAIIKRYTVSTVQNSCVECTTFIYLFIFFHCRTGHKGPDVEQKYSSTSSLTSALDQDGGQCHAPAALPPLAGWAPTPVWTGVETLTPPGFNPLII